jgi:hypothetical protein
MRAFVLVAFVASCSIYDKSLLSSDGGIPVEAGPCGAKTMCVKACVDTQTDGKNCGQCGHDCKGAECKGGACQAIILASALPAPRGIALDNTHVYFSDHGSIATQMVNKDGSGLANFGGPQVFPDVLVLYKGSLYWNNETNLKGAIFSIDTSILPSDTPIKLAVDLPGPTGVAVVNNDVFFTTGPTNASMGCSSSSYVSALMRCSIGGCITVNCGAGGPTPLATGLVDPRGLIADISSIYWVQTSTGSVFTCPTPSCNGGPNAIATGQGGPLDLVMDASNLYWTNTTSGEIATCSRANCANDMRVLATNQMSPRRLALEPASPPTVIWWTSGDGSVKRCLLPSCAGGPTTVAQNIAGAWGIAVDDTYAYVVAEGSQGTTSVDGAILKYPR